MLNCTNKAQMIMDEHENSSMKIVLVMISKNETKDKDGMIKTEEY